MSAIRILTGLWRNSAETSDRAKEPEMKTRYYKTKKRDVIEKITYMINNELKGWTVEHVDEERGEMMIEKKGVIRRNQIVITIIQVEPLKTSVDLVSAYKEGFGDLGLSYFTIIKFFEQLNKKLPLVK